MLPRPPLQMCALNNGPITTFQPLTGSRPRSPSQRLLNIPGQRQLPLSRAWASATMIGGISAPFFDPSRPSILARSAPVSLLTTCPVPGCHSCRWRGSASSQLTTCPVPGCHSCRWRGSASSQRRAEQIACASATPHAGSRGSMEVVPVVVAQNIGISFHIRAWKVCTLNNATG